MDPLAQFEQEKKENIRRLGEHSNLWADACRLMQEMGKDKYTYNFSWMGRPIIQLPQDIIAMQEIIWNVRPDLIIETGIAWGGSLVFYASILELLGNKGQVLGVDIDIRSHNKRAIQEHPMSKRILTIEGSSIDDEVVAQIHEVASEKKMIMVILDSNHTHEHVLQELKLYSPFVTKGSYLIVCDTVIEDVPSAVSRFWGKGNNPKTAVWEFLKTNHRFEIDKEIQYKLLFTVAPDGYLRCVKD
jgi:cephalosporin hydroxylase